MIDIFLKKTGVGVGGWGWGWGWGWENWNVHVCTAQKLAFHENIFFIYVNNKK